MENQNSKNNSAKKVKIVSRKTNEEIDEDDNGLPILGGEKIENNKSEPSDGPISKDAAMGKNTLADNCEHRED